MSACAFCDIVSGTGPAAIVREWPDALAFVPLGPVVPDGGHVLVVPRRHVADAVEDPAITAATMVRAAEFAAGHEASNILTSVGTAATQSIFHLHIHVIRRTAGDQLMVPWGTTGNPHDPHSCARSLRAESEVARYRSFCGEAMCGDIERDRDTLEARLAELGGLREQWTVRRPDGEINTNHWGGPDGREIAEKLAWANRTHLGIRSVPVRRLVGGWMDAEPERSYADKINEPLSEATVVALRDALKSGDYAKYRKTRADADDEEAPDA